MMLLVAQRSLEIICWTKDGSLKKKEILLRIMKASSTPDGRYNLFTNNCQHASTYFRYGIPFSRQADVFFNGIFAYFNTDDFTKSRVLVVDMRKHNSTANDQNVKEIKHSFKNQPYCLPTDSPANADDWDFAGLGNITTLNFAGQNPSLDLQISSLPRNMSNICPKNYFSLTEVMSDAAMIAQRPLRKEVCTLINESNICPRNYFSLTEDDNSIITMPDDDMIAQLPLLAEVCTDISEPYCLPTDSPANADDWDFAGLRNITTSNYAGLNFTVQTPSFPRNMPYCLPTDSPANADDWDFAGLRNITTSNYAGLNFTVQTPSFPRNMGNICPRNYIPLREVMIAQRPLRKEVCTLINETEVCPANAFIEEDKKRKSGFAYNMKRTGNTATETNDHDSYFLWMFLIIAPVLIIITFMFKKIIQTIIQRNLHKITSKRSGRNQVSSL